MPFGTLSAYQRKKYRRNYRRAKRSKVYRRKKKTVAKKLQILSKKVNKDLERRWADNMVWNESLPGAGGQVVQIGLDAIATTPTSVLTNDDRLGMKITLKKLYLKGQIVQADSHNFCRCILVQTMSLNQLVVPADILEPYPTTGQPTIYSPYRKQSAVKYKILLDKFYKLQEQAAGSVYPFLCNFDMSYTWSKGLTVTYNQDAASAPIYTNVVLLLISDSQAITHPQARGAKRLSWVA